MIKLSSPNVGEQELKAVERVFNSSHMAMSKEVFQFEQELEEFIGAPVCCVSSCTSALQLSLQAIGITNDDEVLVPTITYVATFQAVSALGAKPVPCDVDPKTGLLDVSDAKMRISDKTKAIIYVHYASQCHSKHEIYKLAKEYNLRVIEDAAHSFGGYYENKRIGQDSDITCFSFDNIKNITCGDGGAVVTHDKKVIEFVQDARLLGVIGDTQKRKHRERSIVFEVQNQGWRYHMNDISASIGRVQLKRFDELHEKRMQIARLYQKELPNSVLFNLATQTSLHIFPIHIKNRDEIAKKMLEYGIQTGKHYYPNHFLSFYKTDYPLPKAELFYETIFTLPLHSKMTLEDANFVIKNLLEFI